jgi:cell division transport system permease protein
MAISNASERWRRGLEGTYTVQVMPLAGEDEAALDARVARAVALATETPGVARAEPLARARIAQLVEPWLGGGATMADLPLPRLIDVRVADGHAFDAGAFAKALAERVPGSGVDAHGVWLRHLTTFARALEATAAVVVALICIAAVAVVVFATRSGLAVHRDAIEILHLIGARDSTIAREFQLQTMWLGLKGGAFGVALAVALVALLAHFASRIDAALLPDFVLGAAQWTALALLPVASAAIGMETARRTVMRALNRMV